MWKILSQKKIKLARGEGLLTVAACNVGGQPDEEVVPPSSRAPFRANRAKETFEVIKASTVEGDD